MSRLSSDSVKEGFGDRVRIVRSMTYCSQQEFAEQLEVSLRAYRNYERGEREMPASLLMTLYTKYRVDPVWVLTGVGTGKDVIVPDITRLRNRALLVPLA